MYALTASGAGAQGLGSWAVDDAAARELLMATLRNGTDLGERALMGAGQLDAVSDCLADALRHESSERATAGATALEQLEKAASHGVALGRAVEAGRERVLGVLAETQSAAERQAGREGEVVRVLEECAEFVAQAAMAAAEVRDGARGRSLAEAAEAAAVGAGIAEAREGVEAALADNGEARRALEQTTRGISVSAMRVSARVPRSGLCFLPATPVCAGILGNPDVLWWALAGSASYCAGPAHEGSRGCAH
jgi:hypothetical protein